MPTSCDDRRRNRRLPIRMSLRLWRFGLPEQHAEIINISAGGMFFASASRFREGDQIEFEMRLSEELVDTPTTWHCEGQVVRVEGIGSRSTVIGVAVAFGRNRMANAERLREGAPNAA